MSNVYYSISGKGEDSHGLVMVHVRFSSKRMTQRAKTGIKVPSEFFEYFIDRTRTLESGLPVPDGLLSCDTETARRRQYVMRSHGRIVCGSYQLGSRSSMAREAKRKLEDLALSIERSYGRFQGKELPKSWLRERVREFSESPFPVEEGKQRDIYDLMDSFVRIRMYSEERARAYRSMRYRLFIFESFIRMLSDPFFSLAPERLSLQTVELYRHFLRDEHKLRKLNPDLFGTIEERLFERFGPTRLHPVSRERGRNTVVTELNRLRTFFSFLAEMEILRSNPVQKMRVGQECYGTPYALTRDELDMIGLCKLEGRLALQRDIFLFQCSVGCRIGDLWRMQKSNVIGDTLQYVASKTRHVAPRVLSVPLTERALAILERHAAESSDSLFRFTSQQAYNRDIKEIFMKAGISRMVTVLDAVSQRERQVSLCKVASSHLARRTFVDIMYQNGLSPDVISSMTGHSRGSRSFERYHGINDKARKEAVALLDGKYE